MKQAPESPYRNVIIDNEIRVDITPLLEGDRLILAMSKGKIKIMRETCKIVGEIEL
jgi:hypothetical protein